jgi:shikimate kinase
LKSSSSACNAIVSSVAETISEEYGKKGFGDSRDEILDMIRLGVRCAREACVTVTGAFDDACGCHLGGLSVTDNGNDTLIHHCGVEEEDVILLIPETKIRKSSLDVERFRSAADASRSLIDIAKKDWHSALTENGKIVARVAGIDDNVSARAMSMGALAAGVSGTGPAISVVVRKNEGRSFLNDLDHKGYETIMTRTR